MLTKGERTGAPGQQEDPRRMTSKTEPRASVCYAAPKLVVYGDMAALTASGSASGRENTMANSMSMVSAKMA
jgi:hypothetical protein